jgi:hypothetical protein
MNNAQKICHRLGCQFGRQDVFEIFQVPGRNIPDTLALKEWDQVFMPVDLNGLQVRQGQVAPLLLQPPPGQPGFEVGGELQLSQIPLDLLCFYGISKLR